jgi:DNA-binding response OmpR family regulator
VRRQRRPREVDLYHVEHPLELGLVGEHLSQGGLRLLTRGEELDHLAEFAADKATVGEAVEEHVVEVLVRNAGKLVTQRQLLQEVCGPQYEKETNYLRVYLAQIRAKLEPDPARPRYFITEARMGYRFERELRSEQKPLPPL